MLRPRRISLCLPILANAAADPGYFRLIVFIVTAQPFAATGAPCLCLTGSRFRIAAFQSIATNKTSGIGAVAGGISEALVTTAFGLFVAIRAVMAFNYFTNRVEAFDVEMDNSSSELVDYFLKQGARR